MTHHVCCECGKRRERCKAVTRHVDGTVDWCCPACWRQFDYGEFLR